MKKSIYFIFLFILCVVTTITMLPFNVKAEEKVYTLLVNLNNDKDLNVYSGNINYDTNVFEELDENSFDKSDVELINYNKENHKFVVVFRNKKEFKVTFKVKDNAHTNSTVITIKDLISSYENKDIKLDDKNYEVKLLKDKVKLIKEFDTKNNNEIEIKSVLFFNPIIVLMSVIFIAVIYCYNSSFSDIGNKFIKVVVNLVFIIGLVISIIFNYKSYYNKSDINNDIKVNYDDVNEVINYLLDIKGSKNDLTFGFNADINNDRKLTISDVAKVNDNINSYSVSISDIKIDKYVNKNTKFDLIFTVKVSPSETLKEVRINDELYEVISLDNNEYKVELTSPSISGIFNITIDKFILSNNKKVSKEYKTNIDVLKDKPELTDYKYDSFNNLVLFNLIDNDKSIVSADIVFSSNNKEEYKTKINEGENEVLATLKNGKYKITAIINYDLDSNVDKENNYEIKLINKEISVLNDYNFKFNNLRLESVNENNSLSISFNSTNASTYNIISVKVNGEYYNVKQQNNKYIIDIPYIKNENININVESAVLENKKEFIINEHLSLFKNKPNVSNLDLDLDGEILTANYTINDNDKVIRNIYIILKDSIGNIIERKEISTTSNSIKFNKKLNTANKYIVQIISNYNNYDGKNHDNELLAENSFNIEESVKVTSELSDYINKNTNFKIKYKFTDNINEEIKFLYINDEKYEANYQNGYYIVEFNSGNTPKVLTYTLNKIEYSNGVVVDLNYIDNIEVLKDKPKVENYIFEDNSDYPKINFSIKDVDNTFVSGRVIVFDDKNKLYFATNIDINKTEYELKINDNKNYKLKLEINYILDQNNNEKYNKTEYLYETNIKHITDYNFKLNNEKISIKNNENEKTAIITFNSTNSSNYNIKSVIINGNRYEVSKDKNLYKVEVKLNNDIKNIKLESVKLSNGKVFESNINFDIFKTKPTVYNLKSSEDKNNIIVSFNIKDVMNSINSDKVKVTLKSNNKIIKENEVLLTEDKTNISTMFENINSGNYTIDISTSFDLKDGLIHKNEIINEEYDIKIETISNIKTLSISNEYPKKNEIITIKYDITANTNSPVTAIVINSNIYEVIKEKDGYSVKLQSPNDSGVFEYKVTKIYYDNLESNVYLTNKIEVLKDDLIVKNYTFTKENGIAKFTFDIIDTDNVIENGNLIAEVEDQTKNIKVGKNEIEFTNLNDDKNLIFSIKGKYNLKTNNLENNEYNTIFTKPFSMKNNIYNITNLKTVKKYYEKNEKINLSFNYESNSNFYPVKMIINNKEYNITKENNNYITLIDGSNKLGENVIDKIKIKLNNDEIIDISNIINFEILKSKPLVKNFTYEVYNNRAYINFNLSDEDVTITRNAQIKVTDDKNNTIISDNIILGENEIDFSINNIDNFKVEIISNYDLSTAENSNKNSVIYKNNIYLNKHYIEFKDIDEIELYYKNSNKLEKVNNLNLDKFTNLDNFLVKVVMKDLPDFYSEIDSYEIVNNKMIFNLKFDDIIQYDNNKVINVDNISVIFGDVKNNTVIKNDYYKLENNNLNDLYIPNYQEFKKIPNYNVNKNNIYHNLYKLMPFIDSKLIINYANNFNEDDDFNKDIIKTIIPYDKNNNMINYLTTNNYKNISYIKVFFESNEVKNYNVSYYEYKNGIVSYKILDLDIIYNYNKFVINENSNIIKKLINYASNLNYNYDLDPITNINDSKVYSDYYNKYTKNNLNDIVLNLLNSEYSLITNNDNLNSIIEEDLINSNKLKEYLYTYNYFSRFYNFNISNINIRDSLLFNNELFGNKTTLDQIINKIKTSDISTYNTSGFYSNNIASITNINTLQEFLEYFIKDIGKYEDANDWFSENFSGIISEVGIDNNTNVEYRAWYHLKRRPNLILPLITLPKNTGYIISSPSQIIIGSQRVYTKNPNNSFEHKKLVNKINDYSLLIKDFYTNVYNLSNENALNRVSDIQIDKNIVLDDNGNKVLQNKEFMTDEFHKNFNYLVNMWSENGIEKVYSYGDRVMWNLSSILDNFDTYSDKTITNQINKVFMNSVVLRNKNIDFDNMNLKFNLIKNYNSNEKIITNYTPNRIKTISDLEDFYKKLFLVVDLLDYIEANAFLTLTPLEQSSIAVQINYSNDNSIKYTKLTEEQIKNMNLKTVNDLIENRIILKSNLEDEYNIFDSHWYQAYNINGMIQDDISNYFAYEMLGYKGYKSGFINWYNIKSGKNDVQVLKEITGYDSFDEYKISKYDEIDSLWKDIRTNISNGTNYLINPDKVYDEFIYALRSDASNNNLINSVKLKENIYYSIKKNSNDFNSDIFETTSNEKEIHISDAKSLILAISNNQKANIILDNDIDLSNYKNSISIINNVFSGTLNGNNKKLINNQIPIFNLINNAKIENLIIENSNIKSSSNNIGALSKNIENSSITNVIIKKSIINALGNKQIGSLAGSISNTILKDVHVVNGKISGGNRTGGLIGYAINDSSIDECSVSINITSSSSSTGGLVGETYEAKLNNNYVIGEINVKGNINDIGGFIGYANNSQIRYNFAKVIMKSPKNSGGFVGQVVGNANIQNNISFSSSTTSYKFDGRTDISIINMPGYANNYELKDAKGNDSSLRHESLKSKIISIDSKNITEDLFINENKLAWSSDIWNLSDVSIGGVPKLKLHDPNNDLSILKEGIIENKIEGYDKTIMNE